MILADALIGLGAIFFMCGFAAFFYSADRLALHDFGPEETREKAGVDAVRFALGGMMSMATGAGLVLLSFNV